jgi:tetratricopeptide (TPR) repeat protein
MRTAGFNARAIAAAIVFAALPLFGQVADGDRHYENRANGTIDAAIAAYGRAIAANPNDLVAHARLLRAYRFKGAYTTTSVEQKKQVYGTAKSAGEKALTAVANALKSRGVKPDAPEKTIAAAVRTMPGAADIYLWDAVNWGEWALAYGKMAAARQGAADQIKRGATIAQLANPALENGSPSRVLGRLHDQTPRIPFITGWASSKEAVRYLEESRKHDPSNKLTAVFLAEALVSNDAKTKARAVQLLRDAIAAPVDPKFAVEDAAAVADAKALLKKLPSS